MNIFGGHKYLNHESIFHLLCFQYNKFHFKTNRFEHRVANNTHYSVLAHVCHYTISQVKKGGHNYGQRKS